MPDKALEYLEKALALDQSHIVARWNRALALLEKGAYEKGFADYDYGNCLEEPRAGAYKHIALPEWNGAKGQTVIVYGEQGMGDEIMFASVLPDLQENCNVILQASSRLAKICRHSFPGIAVYAAQKDNDYPWMHLHKIDAKIAIGSIAKFYRKSVTDFPGKPYLQANPVIVEKYRERLMLLGNKPKIGISWKGGTKATNMHSRTISLEKWLPVLQCIDADFISLQYTADAKEALEAFTKQTTLVIHHWQSMLDDYDETAGLVSNLDLVISVPQTVVHLAGALGISAWQLTPKKSMWQMGPYGKNMPWYDCVKNIWQDETETWEPVIARAAAQLCRLFSK